MSERPKPGTRPVRSGHGAGHSEVPYLALHPMGFSVPRCLRSARWSLTPPFHPCLSQRPAAATTSAVCFLWHCPSTPQRLPVKTLPACIPAVRPGYAASRPLVFGLSSLGTARAIPRAILRSSKARIIITPPQRQSSRRNPQSGPAADSPTLSEFRPRPRHGHGVATLGIGSDRRRAVVGKRDAFAELEIRGQRLFPGNGAAHVNGGPAHDRRQV